MSNKFTDKEPLIRVICLQKRIACRPAWRQFHSFGSLYRIILTLKIPMALNFRM